MSSYSYRPEPTSFPKLEMIGKSDSSIKTYNAYGIGTNASLLVHLLIDKQTTITAEIFAVALLDNHHALVVGTGDTFGKCRIQNAQPLHGSVVAVTRARHVAPSRGDRKHV